MTQDALPSPIMDPLGDGHHCDIPPTEEDMVLGNYLAYSLGTLYSDIAEDICGDAEAVVRGYGYFFYYTSTPVDEWTRIARALRIHGLKIVNAPEHYGREG